MGGRIQHRSGEIMILLTKLDKTPILVSVEAIKYLEPVPDTLISFLNGDLVLVRESVHEVLELTVKYKASVVSAAAQNDDHDG